MTSNDPRVAFVVGVLMGLGIGFLLGSIYATAVVS